MNATWIVVFAAIAAVGNAIFALGQQQASGVSNGLLFVGGSALIACALCLASSALLGPFDATVVVRDYWVSLLLSGAGLFLTYVGFHLLYTRFGTSTYVVYAAMSILTTTVGVGFLYLKETVNSYHIAAVLFAMVAIVLFSIGQSRV